MGNLGCQEGQQPRRPWRASWRLRECFEGRLFACMDENRSNAVSFGEFCRGLDMVGIRCEHKHYLTLFRAIDGENSKDQSISWNEMKAMLYPEKWTERRRKQGAGQSPTRKQKGPQFGWHQWGAAGVPPEGATITVGPVTVTENSGGGDTGEPGRPATAHDTAWPPQGLQDLQGKPTPEAAIAIEQRQQLRAERQRLGTPSYLHPTSTQRKRESLTQPAHQNVLHRATPAVAHAFYIPPAAEGMDFSSADWGGSAALANQQDYARYMNETNRYGAEPEIAEDGEEEVKVAWAPSKKPLLLMPSMQGRERQRFIGRAPLRMSSVDVMRQQLGGQGGAQQQHQQQHANQPQYAYYQEPQQAAERYQEYSEHQYHNDQPLGASMQQAQQRQMYTDPR